VLRKCQEVFDDRQTNDEVLTQLAKDIKAAKVAGDAKLVGDLEEKMLKLRKRIFGNIKFIGHLYKRGVIVLSIVTYCFIRLITRNQKLIANDASEQKKVGRRVFLVFKWCVSNVFAIANEKKFALAFRDGIGGFI
jgi:hypothetical protein